MTLAGDDLLAANVLRIGSEGDVVELDASTRALGRAYLGPGTSSRTPWR
jgi:hypothetical protein